jgi:protein AroM
MDDDKSRPRMGVVVIGQSPRPSVAAEIAAVLSPGIAIELVGALDGMTRAEIDAIPPTDGSDALFTLLPNGDAVVISKHVVEERAAAKIADFAGKGVAVTMLACTGKFPVLSADTGMSPHGHVGEGEGAPPLVVLPSKILSAMVEAVLPHGRLGVFSPLPEQTELIASKWERSGIDVVGVTLRPGSGPEAVDAAASAMAQHAPDIVVMDCMGYRGADKARVRKLVACPVILAIAAAARVVEELIA